MPEIELQDWPRPPEMRPPLSIRAIALQLAAGPDKPVDRTLVGFVLLRSPSDLGREIREIERIAVEGVIVGLPEPLGAFAGYMKEDPYWVLHVRNKATPDAEPHTMHFAYMNVVDVITEIVSHPTMPELHYRGWATRLETDEYRFPIFDCWDPSDR